ncbi:sensor histidine kinase [Microtetraspora sp. AC03309]|uniref:sensor histidine kinase n=1 Tax=Microtetraspora sp. AC03309 TaxID=2779376 RepID=UPI001E2A5041|nr:nitrate- and nitrite sensing domain-containing protein [Microtetraspora sp. AC03309]MCC5577235.1 sensor histidine kinase [Microtetraspora sp. AC03309]
MIPLISLVALWIFSASLTVGDAFRLLNASTVYSGVGEPAHALATEIEREYLLSAQYLASRSDVDRSDMFAQRAVVDRARTRMRELVADGDAESMLIDASRKPYEDMKNAAARLDTVRMEFDAGQLDLANLGENYEIFPDASQRFSVVAAMHTVVTTAQQGRSLVSIAGAQHVLAKERALVAGVLGQSRTFTDAEKLRFAQHVTTRRVLFDQGMNELDDELRAPLDVLTKSEAYRQVTNLEDRLLQGEVTGQVSPVLWRSVVDRVDNAYTNALSKAGAVYNARNEPAAIGVFVRAGAAGLLGLGAVVASLIISIRMGRGLTRELVGLKEAATELSDVRLPRLVQRLRRGEKVRDVEAEAPPLEPIGSTGEVRDVAAAFSAVQHTAVEAAVDQARTRESVGQALRNLARRSQGLLQRQLRLLDAMQRRTTDPSTMEDLFRLDHLTTRMRRQAEGLIVLAGGSPGRTWRRPVPVADMLQGAVAEVEDYTRVRVYPMSEAAVSGSAVADIIHLFAELIENAAAYSPPHTEVSLRGEAVARGYAVEVEDRGLGLSDEEIDAINHMLASPPELDLADTDRLGLVVVARLASRHGVRVELRPSPFGGTTAIVLLPATLLAATGDDDPEPVRLGIPEGAGT